MRTLALLVALAVPTLSAAAPAQGGSATPERVEEAVAALDAAAKGGDAEVYAKAIRGSVDALDKRVVDAVAKGLKHKDAGVAWAAIETLGRMRHPESLHVLSGYYKSERKALSEDELRLAELLKSIGRLGDPKGIETLVDSPFSAKTYPVIQARLLGLGNIRDARAVAALFDLFEKVGQRDLDRYMDDIRLALVQLSGQDLGKDPRQWKSWWQSNKKGFTVAPEAKPLPAELETRWNEYWGISKAGAEKR